MNRHTSAHIVCTNHSRTSRSGHWIATLAGTAMLALLTAASAPADTIIYSNDFSGSGANTDFPNENPPGNGSWTVASDVYTYTQSGSASGGTNANVDLGSALDGVDHFKISVQFTVQSLSGGGANHNEVALILFADASSPTSYYSATFDPRADGYLADVGTLGFGGPGNSYDTTTIGDSGLGSDYHNILTNTYTLVADVTRTDGGATLNFTASLYDAAGTTQIGTSATATDSAGLLTGSLFGLRVRQVVNGTGTFDFDNFTITAVPEPATLALFGLGGLLIGVRRRRA